MFSLPPSTSLSPSKGAGPPMVGAPGRACARMSATFGTFRAGARGQPLASARMSATFGTFRFGPHVPITASRIPDAAFQACAGSASPRLRVKPFGPAVRRGARMASPHGVPSTSSTSGTISDTMASVGFASFVNFRRAARTKVSFPGKPNLMKLVQLGAAFPERPAAPCVSRRPSRAGWGCSPSPGADSAPTVPRGRRNRRRRPRSGGRRSPPPDRPA